MLRSIRYFPLWSLVPLALACWLDFVCATPCVAQNWDRHSVDQSFHGADGVRLGDFDGDGLQDIVTGWEESGVVRLMLHPGPKRVKETWPAVTLANIASPEDAVPCDVDGDGRLDVISCHEGQTRHVWVHWNNSDGSREGLLDPKNWIPQRWESLDRVQWMFAVPLSQISGRTGVAFGAKNQNASITLVMAPELDQNRDPRNLNHWTTTSLRDAGWIMSMKACDMDGDGDLDIAFSDRKGALSRAAWLEQPASLSDPWHEHTIAGEGEEVMFCWLTPERCLIATRDGTYLDCTRELESDTNRNWTVHRKEYPGGITMGKAIALNGRGEIVLTANTLSEKNPEKPGIWFLDSRDQWSVIDPAVKVKFDRIELLDLDGDGDDDILTCEERLDLGVFWYENQREPLPMSHPD